MSKAGTVQPDLTTQIPPTSDGGRRVAFAGFWQAELWLFVGAVLLPALYLFGLVSIETVNMLGRYMAFAIVAVGLDLVWGYAGILSLCQSMFFALGGYAMGMYLAYHGGPGGAVDASGWTIPACLYVVYPLGVGETEATLPWFWKPFHSFPCAVVLGLLIPGLVAWLVGYVGFKSRVRGVYFSILTQALTVAIWLVFCLNNMKLCGTNGLTRFDNICGFDLTAASTKMTLYIVTVLALYGVYKLCLFITKSRVGRVLIAVRDDEKTLRFSGFRPHSYKCFAYVVAAMTAGLAGVLYAPQMGIFTPSNMEADKSILAVIWVAVGGRGTLSGAVFGALGVNLLYNYLTSSDYVSWWPIIQGLLFIAVVLLFPNGLMGIWRKLSTGGRRVVAAESPAKNLHIEPVPKPGVPS
jgi:urea transport system permease protein